jgi:hypothetical protein
MFPNMFCNLLLGNGSSLRFGKINQQLKFFQGKIDFISATIDFLFGFIYYQIIDSDNFLIQFSEGAFLLSKELIRNNNSSN